MEFQTLNPVGTQSNAKPPCLYRQQMDTLPEWMTGALLMSLATYSTMAAAANALLVTPDTLTRGRDTRQEDVEGSPTQSCIPLSIPRILR